MAAGASGQLALAAHDETALTTFGKRIGGTDVQLALDHELES